jgi:divalent metal cation (Fe/Co/Zn/Cd) transporter
VSDPQRTGRRLQIATIVWNLIEVFVTVALGIAAGSLALVAFGLDSLIEVFASAVVLWHMDSAGDSGRDRRARRLVGAAFAVLALSLTIAAVRALVTQAEPEASPWGIAYLAVTAMVMFGLATWKARIGHRLGSEPFLAEARMTHLDGWLATAILAALALNAVFDWWWADPAAALLIAVVAVREALELFEIADG